MSSASVDGPQPSAPRGTRRVRNRLVTHVRRLLIAASVVVVAAVVFAFLPGRTNAIGTVVGPKQYYLALGDSLAWGYQPNDDFNHGYVQQWYSNYLYPNIVNGKHVTSSVTDYGCGGESTTTFINGGCPNKYLYGFICLPHNCFAGAQLTAGVNFIKSHCSKWNATSHSCTSGGQVSPVSLDIGANDLLPDISVNYSTTPPTCTISSTWSNDLSTMNAHLTQTILPQLTTALNGTGDLVMMNYYNPFEQACSSNPAVAADLQQINDNLSADIHGFPVTLINVGPTTASGPGAFGSGNTCTYTWMCSSYRDIHASGGQTGEPNNLSSPGNGYGVIANAFHTTLHSLSASYP